MFPSEGVDGCEDAAEGAVHTFYSVGEVEEGFASVRRGGWLAEEIMGKENTKAGDGVILFCELLDVIPWRRVVADV